MAQPTPSDARTPAQTPAAPSEPPVGATAAPEAPRLDPVALALLRLAQQPLVPRPWVPLPPAPVGWTSRAGALERSHAGRRWTIGRRAAWDARWQMLLWREGRAYLVRQGEAEHVGGWVELVAVGELFEAVAEGWRAWVAKGRPLEAR